MPVTFAALAGVLAVLNPCGIALLPALLSGTSVTEPTGNSASIGRAGQVGLVLSAGAALAFGIVAVPIAFGAQWIADTVPWIGLILGTVILGLAALTLMGKRIAHPGSGFHPRSGSGSRGLFLAGAGYGITSLGCGLPMFLVAVSTSIAGSDRLAVFGAIAAYAAGMAVILVGLTIIVEVIRDGAQSAISRLRPHMRWMNGGLLLLAGGYLTYYWATVLFASIEARARDPLIGAVERVATRAQELAGTDAGRWLLLAGIALITAVLLRALWRWARTARLAPGANAAESPVGSDAFECGCVASDRSIGGQSRADSH